MGERFEWISDSLVFQQDAELREIATVLKVPPYKAKIDEALFEMGFNGLNRMNGRWCLDISTEGGFAGREWSDVLNKMKDLLEPDSYIFGCREDCEWLYSAQLGLINVEPAALIAAKRDGKYPPALMGTSRVVEAMVDHIYTPVVYLDGPQWCALYGENLQEGVAGFGDTPAAAVRAFNKAWTELAPPPRAEDLFYPGELKAQLFDPLADYLAWKGKDTAMLCQEVMRQLGDGGHAFANTLRSLADAIDSPGGAIAGDRLEQALALLCQDLEDASDDCDDPSVYDTTLPFVLHDLHTEDDPAEQVLAAYGLLDTHGPPHGESAEGVPMSGPALPE